MEKKTFHHGIIVAAAAVVFCGAALAVLLFRHSTKSSEINIMGKFEAENFLRAIDRNGDVFAKCENGMVGAIVPHHMVGGKFIADVFSSARDIDTVVLLGPNHFEKGDSAAITSENDWTTAKGTVSANKELASELISKKIALAQDEVISKDHSIGNILPFIKYYLPDVKVVPIVLKRNVPNSEFDELLQVLANWGKTKKVLFIGSVDFSHYLSEQESEKKDVQTIGAIEDRNYGLLNSLGSDNLDSPPTVNMVLKVIDLVGRGKMSWRNSNSFKILGGDISNTTSYFELVFCKP